MTALKKAFALLRSGVLLREAIVELEASECALVRELAQLIRGAKRGIYHPSLSA